MDGVMWKSNKLTDKLLSTNQWLKEVILDWEYVSVSFDDLIARKNYHLYVPYLLHHLVTALVKIQYNDKIYTYMVVHIS